MIRIGIWSNARHLIAVPDFHREPPALHLRARRSFDGREQLAGLLARDPYLEVVIPECLHRFDPVAEHLRTRSILVCVVPVRLFDDMISLLALRRSEPIKIAAALARLPLLPSFRPGLRPLPIPDRHQLAFPQFS